MCFSKNVFLFYCTCFLLIGLFVPFNKACAFDSAQNFTFNVSSNYNGVSDSGYLRLTPNSFIAPYQVCFYSTNTGGLFIFSDKSMTFSYHTEGFSGNYNRDGSFSLSYQSNRGYYFYQLNVCPMYSTFTGNEVLCNNVGSWSSLPSSLEIQSNFTGINNSIIDDSSVGSVTGVTDFSQVLFRTEDSLPGLYPVTVFNALNIKFNTLSSTGLDLTNQDCSFEFGFNFTGQSSFSSYHRINENINGSLYPIKGQYQYLDHYIFTASELSSFFESLGQSVYSSNFNELTVSITPYIGNRKGVTTYYYFKPYLAGSEAYSMGSDSTNYPDTSDLKPITSGTGDTVNEAIDSANSSAINGFNLDTSNITSSISSFFSQLGSFPLIFQNLFSWLPSWVLQYFVALISLVALIVTIKIVLLIV